jgi:hypothetical protein
MIEQKALMDIDGQMSWVEVQLDLSEPLVAFEKRMPETILGQLLDVDDHQRFQLALGRVRRIVLNEENTLYRFSFCEETFGFVAVRENSPLSM